MPTRVLPLWLSLCNYVFCLHFLQANRAYDETSLCPQFPHFHGFIGLGIDVYILSLTSFNRFYWGNGEMIPAAFDRSLVMMRLILQTFFFLLTKLLHMTIQSKFILQSWLSGSPFRCHLNCLHRFVFLFHTAKGTTKEGTAVCCCLCWLTLTSDEKFQNVQDMFRSEVLVEQQTNVYTTGKETSLIPLALKAASYWCLELSWLTHSPPPPVEK